MDPIEPYDISLILHQMELDLIASQKRTLALHLAWEREEGFEWEQWQNRKLEALRELKAEQEQIVRKAADKVDRSIDELLFHSFAHKAETVDKLFRNARRFISKPGLDDRNFFGIHLPKLQALIDAAKEEHRIAEHAVLRLMDDEYRKILYKTQVYLNTGSLSLYHAIDQASKEFLIGGIRSVTYRNGMRVNIASYSEMAMRTANVRAQAVAQGAVMDDWGEHLVKLPRLGSTCDLCAPWQGRVFIDNVYANGNSNEGKYPLLSTAIDNGLGHPNCRHLPGSPWFPGVNEPERRMSKDERERIRKNYEAEEQQRYIERQIRKNKRLAAGSVDPGNANRYVGEVKVWQRKMREHLDENLHLRRIRERERIRV